MRWSSVGTSLLVIVGAGASCGGCLLLVFSVAWYAAAGALVGAIAALLGIASMSGGAGLIFWADKRQQREKARRDREM